MCTKMSHINKKYVNCCVLYAKDFRQVHNLTPGFEPITNKMYLKIACEYSMQYIRPYLQPPRLNLLQRVSFPANEIHWLAKNPRKTKTENSKVARDQNITSYKFMIVLESKNFISVIR